MIKYNSFSYFYIKRENKVKNITDLYISENKW